MPIGRGNSLGAVEIDKMGKISYNVNNVVIKHVFNGGLLMQDVNELLEIAIKETDNLIEGEVFLVKELFKGYEWNRISHSKRLLLGTLFLNYINKTNNRIVRIEKTSSGQQKYKKC